MFSELLCNAIVKLAGRFDTRAAKSCRQSKIQVLLGSYGAVNSGCHIILGDMEQAYHCDGDDI
jgi:hypothetical protein